MEPRGKEAGRSTDKGCQTGTAGSGSGSVEKSAIVVGTAHGGDVDFDGAFIF